MLDCPELFNQLFDHKKYPRSAPGVFALIVLRLSWGILPTHQLWHFYAIAETASSVERTELAMNLKLVRADS